MGWITVVTFSMDYTGQGHFGGGFPRAPGRESGSSSRFMGPYAPQHSITTFPPESSSVSISVSLFVLLFPLVLFENFCHFVMSI